MIALICDVPTYTGTASTEVDPWVTFIETPFNVVCKGNESPGLGVDGPSLEPKIVNSDP